MFEKLAGVAGLYAVADEERVVFVGRTADLGSRLRVAGDAPGWRAFETDVPEDRIRTAVLRADRKPASSHDLDGLRARYVGEWSPHLNAPQLGVRTPEPAT